MAGFEVLGNLPAEGTSAVKPANAIAQLLGEEEDQGAEPQQDQGDAGQAVVVPGLGVQPEQSDEDDPGEEESEVPRFKVKVDGEELEVDQNELLAGYRRHADYTRKTQELALERQQFAQQAQAALQDREQYKYLVMALGDKLKTMGGEEPDWQKLAAENPANYVQHKAAWDHRQRQIAAIEQEQGRLAEEDRQQNSQRYQSAVEWQKNQLLSARPELAEVEKARDFFTGISAYARDSFGFTDQELAGILDHRLYLLAEKAMKFDQLQAQGEPVVKQVASRQILKPGSKRVVVPEKVQKSRNAQDRLRRTGSTRDAAAMIESMLD